MRENALATIKN